MPGRSTSRSACFRRRASQHSRHRRADGRGLERGAASLGGAPYADSDPHGQIDRIFELAREFDVDIDMHLDFGPTADGMDLEHVCERTERIPLWRARRHRPCDQGFRSCRAGVRGDRPKRLADAGVALTVLPSTDLYLMGRQHTHDHNVTRGVVPAHKLLHHGVNCSLSSNNILNPFTPFGDCSQMRMANLYANICQVGKQADLRECFDMVTRAAGAADAARRLRPRRRQIRRPGGARFRQARNWPSPSWRRCSTPSSAAARPCRGQPAILHRPQ